MKSDKQFMEFAIELAKKGIYTTSPNPSVGCVITEKNKILSKAYHLRSGSDHAEVLALKKLNKRVNSKMNMYVSLEPCCHTGKTGPCTKSIIDSGIKNVFVSTLDPNPKVKGKGVKELRNNGINVNVGLCKKKSQEINKGFFKRIIKKTPYVIAKQALSSDFKINGSKNKWISNSKSRTDVQYFRAESCAILVSSKTIKTDNPSLKVKLKKNDLGLKDNIKHPVRIVLDTNLSLDLNKYKFFKGKEKKIVFNSLLNSSDKEKNIDFIKVREDKSGLNIKNVLNILALKYEINNLFIEPGAKLLDTLLQKRLLDKLVLYQSPHIIGNLGLTTLNMENKVIKDKTIVTESIMNFSNDVRIIYKFLRK